MTCLHHIGGVTISKDKLRLYTSTVASRVAHYILLHTSDFLNTVLLI